MESIRVAGTPADASKGNKFFLVAVVADPAWAVAVSNIDILGGGGGALLRGVGGAGRAGVFTDRVDRAARGVGFLTTSGVDVARADFRAGDNGEGDIDF